MNQQIWGLRFKLAHNCNNSFEVMRIHWFSGFI